MQRLRLCQTSCMEPLYAWFYLFGSLYFLSQLLQLFGRMLQCCCDVKLQKCSPETLTELTFHQHGAEEMMSQFYVWVDCSLAEVVSRHPDFNTTFLSIVLTPENLLNYSLSTCFICFQSSQLNHALLFY